MNIADFLTSPWAIIPDKLIEMQEIYRTHLKGDKIDLEAIEARLGRPLANEQQDYTVTNGVAVLPISGVISNKANMFTRVSGMASASMLQKQIDSMAADPRVKAVVLDIDSPGGSVLGIPALASAIKSLSDSKPTCSVCTGVMASAGYWLGSSSNEVYISGLTDYVGSIGVVATHNYNPRASDGKTTEITAGKYKRMASDNAPLTAEGAAYLQAQVDEIYRVFVETVAQNRKVSAEDVLAHMADGKIFIGQQAINAGLVDGVATVDQIVEKMMADASAFSTRKKAKITASAENGGVPESAIESDQPVLQVVQEPIEPKGTTMNHDEIVAQFEAEHPEAAAMLRAAGATAERERIQGVRAQAMPGHEALIESLAFDGKTTGPEAAVQILAAEKAKVTTAVENRNKDAITPVKTQSAELDAPEPQANKENVPSGFSVNNDRAKLDAAAKAYMAEHKCDYLTAVKAVQKGA